MTRLLPIPRSPAVPSPARAEILEYAEKAPHLDFTAALEKAFVNGGAILGHSSGGILLSRAE